MKDITNIALLSVPSLTHIMKKAARPAPSYSENYSTPPRGAPASVRWQPFLRSQMGSFHYSKFSICEPPIKLGLELPNDEGWASLNSSYSTPHRLRSSSMEALSSGFCTPSGNPSSPVDYLGDSRSAFNASSDPFTLLTPKA